MEIVRCKECDREMPNHTSVRFLGSGMAAPVLVWACHYCLTAVIE